MNNETILDLLRKTLADFTKVNNILKEVSDIDVPEIYELFDHSCHHGICFNLLEKANIERVNWDDLYEISLKWPQLEVISELLKEYGDYRMRSAYWLPTGAKYIPIRVELLKALIKHYEDRINNIS